MVTRNVSNTAHEHTRQFFQLSQVFLTSNCASKRSVCIRYLSSVSLTASCTLSQIRRQSDLAKGGCKDWNAPLSDCFSTEAFSRGSKPFMLPWGLTQHELIQHHRMHEAMVIARPRVKSMTSKWNLRLNQRNSTHVYFLKDLVFCDRKSEPLANDTLGRLRMWRTPSRTCATFPTTSRSWVSEGFFLWRVNGGFFPGGGQTAVKFHFTNSKLRENYFSTKKLTGKYQISKSRGSKALFAPPFRRPRLPCS